eukprot:122147-Ditylum_brightwellii.AAC.1
MSGLANGSVGSSASGYSRSSTSIEEEALPPKEKVEALVACAENPIHDDNNGNDNDATHCIEDDNSSSNITTRGPGSFVLISDEDIDKIKWMRMQFHLTPQPTKQDPPMQYHNLQKEHIGRSFYPRMLPLKGFRPVCPQ